MRLGAIVAQALTTIRWSVPTIGREGRPSSALGQLGPMGKSQETCKKYNRFDGDCKFGARCRFQHECIICRGDHPKAKCTKAKTAV